MSTGARLPRVRCRCGSWMIFVRNERKPNGVFPINAEPSDCSDPLATLARVKSELGWTDVVRFVKREERHKYRYLYVPHHVTCSDERFTRRRAITGKTPADTYQAELDVLRDWRESRERD